MSTKIGHFEILSELAKSATGTVYKANDPQSGQTVALKAIQLSAFGDVAADVEKSLLEEAESTKALSSPNIAPVYGAGEIEGQFCAAMEYVQGNSIATMLARKEGFSIWDLLDIGRQVCGGFEHAQSSGVVHYSLEPAKVMCGWDGTVKILAFGVSSAGKFVQHIPGPVPSFLYYMSPEQVRGEALDSRSNLFSLGAMLYEMVTDRKAFDGGDVESLRKAIVESTPVAPVRVNGKVHPLLSDLIVKALEKDPSQRYQRGRELLDDLENCKESKPQAAKKSTEAPKTAAVPDKQRIVAQSKSATETRTPPAQSATAAPLQKKLEATPKASAVAAGAGNSLATSSVTPEFDAPSDFITSCVKATIDATAPQAGHMSSAVTDEPEVETFAADTPKIAVDPLMAEGGPNRGGGTSFSEISELPPLKEIYVTPEPPRPAPVPAAASSVTMFEGVVEKKEEKPKIQPRKVAEKAIKEIKGVPPRLMLYSLAGAAILILIIAGALAFRIHNQNSDDDPGAAAAKAAAEAATQAPSSKPAPENVPVSATVTAAVQPTVESEQPELSQTRSVNSATAGASAPRTRTGKKKAVAAAVIFPGQVVVDSTPQGAQVQVDGKSDTSWITPLTVSSLQPGQHSITVSKSGYSSDTRSVEIASGSKSSIVLHLAQLMASLAVNSDPPAASVFVDGKDIGKTTPAQVSVDKGQHVVLVRKLGYIDETSSAQFVPGQTINVSLTLRPLGNVDSIKSVGKMKKLFGGNGGQPGQATLSIRTQPKGAQVAVNQHILDKGSPLDVMLDPGNYVIDITLSGYASIHTVISADKGGKVVVDEVLQRQ